MEDKLTKKLVLLVEDEAPMLQALSDTFTNAGFEVGRAKNGAEGLRMAFRNHPDLIVLDILMPELDGMSLIKDLRQDVWGSKVPVIILTNVNPSTDTILQSIIDSKPAYFLIKSNVTLDDILEKAKDALGLTNNLPLKP